LTPHVGERRSAIISQVLSGSDYVPSRKAQRGSPYAQELISHLQPDSAQRNAGAERLDLQVNGQGMCYLILEGTIAVYRRSDNMMLSTARSPAFWPRQPDRYFFDDYLKTVSPC
jgi:hypothetical protein